MPITSHKHVHPWRRMFGLLALILAVAALLWFAWMHRSNRAASSLEQIVDQWQETNRSMP